MRNKGFFITWILYIVLAVTDFVTTLMNKDVWKVLEVNPLYTASGSLILPILLNLAVIFILYYLYKRSPTMRFTTINLMVIVIFVRIFAIKNALSYYFNPISVETAKAIATPAAVQATINTLAIMTYAPLFISLITFFIWKVDHVISKS